MRIAGGLRYVSSLVGGLEPAPEFEESRQEGRYAQSVPGGETHNVIGDDRVR